MTLLFPGLGHLWLGRLLAGTLVSFFSALSVLVLFDVTSGDIILIRRIAIWVLFWLPWVAFWYWQIRDQRRCFVEVQQVVTAITLLLIASNVSVFLTTLFLFMGWNHS